MEKYDYEEAVKNDLAEFIRERARDNEWTRSDLERHEDGIRDDAMCEDSVTGNGSGYYTCSTWQAEENLCHNWDLVQELADEFGDDFLADKVKDGPKAVDVCVRCLVLDRVWPETFAEICEEFPDPDDDDEDEDDDGEEV